MFSTKTRRQDPRRQDEPDEVARVRPQTNPAPRREQQDRQRGEPEGALIGARVRMAETREEEGQDRRDERRTRALAHAPVVTASRVGYPDARSAGRRPLPSRGPMFRPVSAKPDLVAQEHELLARLARASDVRAAARPERWRAPLELPRRADHRQQPDGRPPRLGPDLQGRLPAATTRCSARTSAGRTASTARGCGSRSTSSATWASRASATSRRSASPSSSRSASSGS